MKEQINPIIVRDCEDMLFPDAWALDLDGETIAYVYGEDLGGLLSNIFDPHNQGPLELLDIVIHLMRAGTALARDFERLRAEYAEFKTYYEDAPTSLHRPE